jgi:hypothetical protein
LVEFFELSMVPPKWMASQFRPRCQDFQRPVRNLIARVDLVFLLAFKTLTR